jgi:arsenate reductase
VLENNTKILFVCVENAGRSQMAEALARKIGLNATSAGTVPSTRINPTVVEAMKEKGINISENSPKMLTPPMINDATLVITMGCSVSEVCPKPMLAQMQKKLIDWNLDDPKGKSIEKVREIRDEIEKRIIELSRRITSQKGEQNLVEGRETVR